MKQLHISAANLKNMQSDSFDIAGVYKLKWNKYYKMYYVKENRNFKTGYKEQNSEIKLINTALF